jgi:hypothetical protein
VLIRTAADLGAQKYPEVPVLEYSLFWNHIVGKTKYLHVLTPAFKNQKMNAPFWI